MKTDLWPHQSRALEALRQTVRQGVRRIVVQSPTGSGKTKLSAAIVESAREKDKRVAFCVNAVSLVSQTVEMFWNEGIRDIGVIQAAHELQDWSKPVQICSIQTLDRRSEFPRADIVIIDEVHSLHKRHREWLTHDDWKNVPFIGISATPWSIGLGRYFDTLLIAATTKELISEGLLSPFRVFAAGHPDLRNIKIVAGDYHEGQLSEAMQQGTLVADVIETWKKLWGRDKTFVYGVDRAHAKNLQERFIRAGIKAEYQDAYTTDLERREIKRKFHSGECQIVCNVATLTTGVDYDVRCLVLCRPTKSEILFTQIIGRALRTTPGKDYALILDHSDSTQRLGFVTDIHHDRLNTGKKAEPQEAKPRIALPKECKSCGYLKPPKVSKCPHCGFESRAVNGVIERDGELVDVTGGQKRVAKKEYTLAEKQLLFAELRWYAAQHGYKEGWAANKYREKFKVWPNIPSIRDAMPIEPGPKTLSWIRSKNIQWAKSKRNAEYVVA
jgi:superfamily II DNA or RNA helicase